MCIHTYMYIPTYVPSYTVYIHFLCLALGPYLTFPPYICCICDLDCNSSYMCSVYMHVHTCTYVHVCMYTYPVCMYYCICSQNMYWLTIQPCHILYSVLANHLWQFNSKQHSASLHSVVIILWSCSVVLLMYVWVGHLYTHTKSLFTVCRQFT